MSRPRRMPALVVAATLAALATSWPATAQEPEAPVAPAPVPPAAPAPADPAAPAPVDPATPAQSASPLEPQFFDLVRRTLEQIHADLLAVEPAMAPDVLRGRLLIEARQLINNVTESGIEPDRLLTLPEPLGQDASRLVALVLGERDRPATGVEPGTDDRAVPVRIRPFERLLAEVMRMKFDELTRSGIDDPSSRLEAEAPGIVAGAVSPSNDPSDLVPDERAYAVALARRVASQGGDAPPGDDAMQDDLDALAELLRRRDAELRLREGVEGIEERAQQLEQFGIERLEEAIRQRDPAGTIPDSARDQVRSIAALTARGIPLTTETVEEPAVPGGPTGEVSTIDPAILDSATGLARSVDRGLITAGVDLPTRRATLRRFILEWVARKSGTSVDALPDDVVAEADRLVEQILGESPETTAIGPPTVAPPIVTLPVTPVTVPTVTTTTYVLVPGGWHPWCLPWK